MLTWFLTDNYRQAIYIDQLVGASIGRMCQASVNRVLPSFLHAKATHFVQVQERIANVMASSPLISVFFFSVVLILFQKRNTHAG